MDLGLEDMTGGGAASCISTLVCKSIVVTVTVILTLMVLCWVVRILTAPRFPLVSAMLSDATPGFLIAEGAKYRSNTLNQVTGDDKTA